jgi:hypothetical protein
MTNSQTEAYGKMVARAWSGPQLLADPIAALATVAAPVPPGLRIKVVENTEDLVHLVLRPPPADAVLSDEALERAVGGVKATV